MPLVGPHQPIQEANVISGFYSWSIQRKLLLTLLPSVVLMLMCTGYVTHWFSSRYLNTALERTVALQVMGMAHAMEEMLSDARTDLLTLARSPLRKEDLARFLALRMELRGDVYREAAFISNTPNDSVYLLHTGETIVDFPAGSLSQIKPNPMLLAAKVASSKPGTVLANEMIEAFFPLPAATGGGHLACEIFRLATPVSGPDGTVIGFVMLSLDARRMRDILSLYNSPQSPLYAFPRTAEKRFAYFVDRQGWMLFQSETPEERQKDLSTGTARTGYSGDYGKPGYDGAFRPNASHEAYWRMVVDVQSGRHGVLTLNNNYEQTQSVTDQIFLGYAPMSFSPSPDSEPEILGGVAYVDRSRLTAAAELRQFDVMFIISLTTTLLVAGIITALSRVITHPIRDLSAAVTEIIRTRRLKEISLPDHDQETKALKDAINRMIIALLAQKEEIRLKDRHIQNAQQRERVLLEDEIQPFLNRHQGQEGCEPMGIVDIVGMSPVMENLKGQILKAASVDADVLIIGETGTGKELTAEAIHKCSPRTDKPFISINCGALDENLLLDALFGHVKGAFSEAKADRKGAFLAAHGGTLLLDEIGNASAKVQQALLRALSVRRITPLGSDEEIEVDVRLVAATNVELDDLVRDGAFRADLYYRLKVITLRTPPLRDHPEDIPILADFFLKEAALAMKKEGVGFSRGALEKLKHHSWPGNIRELKNCITRSVAMIEGEVIHVEDLHFETERPDLPDLPRRPRSEAEPRTAEEAAYPGLNQRQRKALPHLLQHGEISRGEYQKILGNDLPLRTAQYDLHDLVKKGVLKKTGKGPATRYLLAKLHNTAQ